MHQRQLHNADSWEEPDSGFKENPSLIPIGERRMSEEINHERRRFLRNAAMTLAATKLAMIGSADAQSSKISSPNVPPIKPGAHTSFTAIKQINAGVLDVGYAEAGPINGPAVVLLHGWPYDIHSYVDVAPLLASAGYRVIIPYLRGYGTTRFLSSKTFRNAQQSVVALDIIALMDALRMQKAIIAGYDWGARTADIIAALWPERCKAIISCNGYLITNREANKRPLPPRAEWAWWYQYYFFYNTWAGRSRRIPPRFCQADLEEQFSQMGLR
jgi:alpha/beta hydrolase fold